MRPQLFSPNAGRTGRKGTWKTGVLAALGIFFQASFAFSGMVIEEKNELVGEASLSAGKARGPMTGDVKTYIQGKKVRIDTGEMSYILDFEKGVMLTLKAKNKTYTVMTKEQVKDAQKKAFQWIENMRKMAEKRLESLPPEKRKAMRKKLDAFPQPQEAPDSDAKVEVRETGRERSINGFPCREYDVYRNEEKSATYWLTRAVSTKEFDAYQQEKKKWLTGMGPSPFGRSDAWVHIQDKGFPVEVIRFKPVMGKSSFRQEVKRVEHKALPDSLFEPPADFKKMETSNFSGFGRSPGKPPASRPPPSGT